jgi:hypothetical protein
MILCILNGPGQMPIRMFPGFHAFLSGTQKNVKSAKKNLMLT